MRYSQALDSLFPQIIHPIPETFGILGVIAAEGDRGDFIPILEKDVTMEISSIIGKRGVLIPDEGCKSAGIIVFFCCLDYVRPGGSSNIHRHFLVKRSVLNAFGGQPAQLFIAWESRLNCSDTATTCVVKSADNAGSTRKQTKRGPALLKTSDAC